jgi:hypothetical protein
MQRLYGRDTNKRANIEPTVEKGTMPQLVRWGAHGITFMRRPCGYNGLVV